MNSTYEYERAEYTEQRIKEYKCNPLIEALPEILDTDMNVIQALMSKPSLDDIDRYESNRLKAHYIERTKQLVIPLPVHLRLESMISVMIRNSYIYRNPLSRDFVESLNELSDLKEDVENLTLDELERIAKLSHPAQCIFINGLSGMGKTTAVNRILSLYPQIIRHEEYKGIPFIRTQLVWLKIDCPYDGNFTTLCRSVFSEVDRVTGERYLEKYGYLTRSTSTMLMHLTHLLKIYNVGILVIDEIQNLVNGKDDPNKMLDFFVTLTNIISLPVVFIGTNRARTLFQKNLRLARRVQSDGYIEISNIQKDSSSWKLITKSLFDFAMVDINSINRTEVNDAFYDESQGIISIVFMLFRVVQIAAMNRNITEITADFVREIAKSDLPIMQPMIKALRSGNPIEIARFDDLTVDENQVLNHYYRDMELDETRQRLINESILELKEKRESKEDKLYTEFYLSKLFTHVPNDIMRKIINNVVKSMGIDEEYEDIKEKCHELLYKENIKRKPKTKKSDTNLADKGLIDIYKEALENKRDPYDYFKEYGYIKNPFEEFNIG